MELENKTDEIEIDLKELAKAVISKWFLIFLVGVILASAVFSYTKFVVDPIYTSSTQVYILNKPETDSLTTSDLAFATYLALDYQELIVSQPVLKEVITKLNLNMTTKTLASRISVKLIEDTRIIRIDVTDTSPHQAKAIADAVRDAVNEKTKDIMGGIEAVNAIDDATLPVVPSSPNIIKNTVIGFIAGAGIVMLIVIILFLMDDTIKTPEDIEKHLGISVLAAIPMQKTHSKGNGKKKKRKNSSYSREV